MGCRLAAGVDLGAVNEKVRPTPFGVLDHRLESLRLGPKRRHLALDASEGVVEDRPPLGEVTSRAEADAVAAAGRLVLEQLRDLCQAEAGVIPEVLDEAEALDVVIVVEPVVTLAPGGRGEQAELLVIADRPRRQTEGRRDLLDAEQAAVGRGRGADVEVAHGPTGGYQTLPLT